MISRKFRFRGRAGIRFAYRSGRAFRTQDFSIKVAENNKQPNYRLAVVVSKKTSKSAVRRNRIRRRIYDSVRSNQDIITKPFDMVITVHNEDVGNMSAEELNRSLAGLLREAKVIN